MYSNEMDFLNYPSLKHEESVGESEMFYRLTLSLKNYLCIGTVGQGEQSSEENDARENRTRLHLVYKFNTG